MCFVNLNYFIMLRGISASPLRRKIQCINIKQAVGVAPISDCSVHVISNVKFCFFFLCVLSDWIMDNLLFNT